MVPARAWIEYDNLHHSGSGPDQHLYLLASKGVGMSGPLLRVFDYARREIASLMPDVQSVSWVLNDVGQAKFFVPYTDDDCTIDVLGIGNFILFEWAYPEHYALPTFGGVIDVPRSRGSNGVVLTAYTGERLLSRFETAPQAVYSTLSAGNIYAALIEAAKVKNNPGLIQGAIFDSGDILSKEWNSASLLDVTRGLVAETGQDFGFIPSVAGGVLSFTYNWYLTRGSDVSEKVLLAEGVNAGAPALDEQGPIVNQVRVYGAGSTWDAKRLKSPIINDDTSLADYGYRETSFIDQGSKDQTTVNAVATRYLADHKDPVARLSLEGIVDKAPGRWRDYDLGDVVSVDVCTRGAAGGWRIKDKYRIMGMQWNPDNTLRLDLMLAVASDWRPA